MSISTEKEGEAKETGVTGTFTACPFLTALARASITVAGIIPTSSAFTLSNAS